MRLDRWSWRVDTFFAAWFVLVAVDYGVIAHDGGFAIIAYGLAVLVAVFAVLVAVVGRRFGMDSDELSAARLLLRYSFVIVSGVYVVHDLMTGKSVLSDGICLLACLLSTRFGNRGGRRHLHRFIGEKSRALLAKLQIPSPARATR